jgi:hypothetical protein
MFSATPFSSGHDVSSDVPFCNSKEEPSMSEETITLTPHHYGKLGLIHCGVTYEGFIAVAGDTRDIADGQEILFERTGVLARRKGGEYTFTRVAKATAKAA